MASGSGQSDQVGACPGSWAETPSCCTLTDAVSSLRMRRTISSLWCVAALDSSCECYPYLFFLIFYFWCCFKWKPIQIKRVCHLEFSCIFSLFFVRLVLIFSLSAHQFKYELCQWKFYWERSIHSRVTCFLMAKNTVSFGGHLRDRKKKWDLFFLFLK